MTSPSERESGKEKVDLGLMHLIPNILRTVDETLENGIGPEIVSANGRVLLDMVRSLLYWSQRQLECHAELYEARLADFSVQLQEQLLSAASPFPAAEASASERRYFDVSERLSRDLAISIANSTPGLAERLRCLLRTEEKFHSELDPESISDPSTAYHGGKSAGRPSFAEAEPALTPEIITAYLRRRFPDCPEVGVMQEVTRLTGGMGKDTILLEVTGHRNFSGSVVLRKDMKAGFSDRSAIEEFPLICALYEAGLPVPQPLWAEADARQLGTPFIATRRVSGCLAAKQDFSDPSMLGEFVNTLAEGLARIHNCSIPNDPWFARAPHSIAECVLQQVVEFEDFWRARRLDPSVSLDVAFTWLRTHVPDDPGFAPTIVHGDYGFHNVILDDGRITGILDWEMAHIGDPAEDVAYCRQFLEPRGAWQNFLTCYAAHGGRSYDNRRDGFFAIWQNVRNAVFSSGALNAFARSRLGNLRMGTAGLMLRPRFELHALRQIIAAVE